MSLSQDRQSAIRPWPQWPPHDRISVSDTSLKMLHECPRRWLMRYRWWTFPVESQRQIRAEGKLMPWEALVGRIVDDVLKDAFREARERSTWTLDLPAHAQWVLEKLIEDSTLWNAAVRDPRIHPRDWPDVAQPIDRLFYGDVLPHDVWQNILERVHVCLDHFATGSIRDEMELIPKRHWMCPKRRSKKPPVWFLFDGTPTYAAYDLMVRFDDAAWIIDWKSGRRSSGESSARAQLAWYAAYAIHDLCLPRERIRAAACWLAEQPAAFDSVSYVVPEEEIEAAFDRIREGVRRLNPIANLPFQEALSAFPAVSQPRACRTCVFRSCPDRCDS